MLVGLETELMKLGVLSITPVTLILLTVLIVLFLVLILLIRSFRARNLRNQFSRQYNVKLDPKVCVKRRRSSESNCLRLEFPYWTRSNKDGSQDKRYKYNRINYGVCQLEIDDFSIFVRDPEQLIWLVNTLRRDGVPICMCPQEHDKYMNIVERANLLTGKGSLKAITEAFQESPTDFEEYCAALFRAKGYQAQTTSRTRDGGYDIEMISPIGENVIVECKCYAPSHKIDRPTIQKLVGANAVSGAKRMVFMTTSDFTPDAYEYAKNAGVELINGKRLLGMVGKNSINEVQLEIPISQWQLTWEDLQQYYPPDYKPLRIEL